MKNRSIIVAFVGILMLLAVITVPSALAQDGIVYLDPQHSEGIAGGDIYVQVMLDLNTSSGGYSTDIYFDPAIVNITNVDFPAGGFGYNAWDCHGDHIYLSAMGTVNVGTYALANLTLRGIAEGTSNIEFNNTELSGPMAEKLTKTTVNGTYTIGYLQDGKFYLDPQYSEGIVDRDTYVQVMIDLNTGSGGYSTDIYFNPAIVNITNVDFPAGGFGYNAWDWHGDHIFLTAMGSVTAGTYTLANLTLRGIGTGTSHLNFSGTLLSDPSGGPLTTSTENGTYTAALPPGVVINEFVAKPNITQTSEWIELYNPTGGDVSLDGWTIEDNTASPKSLTGKTVPANGYLVLNKSEGDFGFALNNDDDIIILKNAAVEVDRVAYGNFDDGNTADNAPAPDEDNSTGRFPNGVDTDNDSADFRVFDTPTPGATNTEAGAVPTADSLGVEDTGGSSGTYVVVPVNITNVMNGPVLGIGFEIAYDKNVINVTDVSKGNLVSNWAYPNVNNNFTWGTTITITGFFAADAIPDGSTGSVVLLNFSVIGSPGDTSSMNMTFIELSNPDGNVGTAPAKNGTFRVSGLGSIVGRITYTCNETGIAGVNVNLTNESIVNTTVTNETGYYNFTDVIPGSYFVNASKSRFWDNSTEVTVIAGETTTADMTLWLKGDLNGDGKSADIGDLVLMNRASVGEITGDWRYDLNKNGIIADIGDLVLMNRASVNDIELL